MTFIYMYTLARSQRHRRETTTKERRRRERCIKQNVLVEADSLREKVEFGSKGPLDFVSADEC